MNLKGDVDDRFNLKASLGKYYVLPNNNPHINQIQPVDFYKKKTSSENKLNMASFGDIYFDDISGFIYIYGQYGSKSPGNYCNYEGVFIQKYSLNGDVEWRTKQSFPSNFAAKDPFLSKHETELYGRRVINFIIDKATQSIRYEMILYNSKKGNNRAYVSKWDSQGNFLNTIRGINKPRNYMRNRTYNDDPYTYIRNYEYDDYYTQGEATNSEGEDRFQELANLTPGLNIATYEYMSFPIGEIVMEKLNERKALVFYFIKRE